MGTPRHPHPESPRRPRREPPASTSAWPLACTVCGETLSREADALVCPRRHSFDVARQGYANLLTGGKRSASLGDSVSMLRARRAFLDGGHYAPLAAALAERTRQCLDAARGSGPLVVCDVGCGEGYYLGAIRGTLAVPYGSESSPVATPASYFGIDVAKEATRMAAGRHVGITFVVADAWKRLPLVDSSVTVLLNVFAPRNPAEFARVLAPGGTVVVATPGVEHLAELRQRWGLLQVERDKAAHLCSQLGPTLSPVSAQHLRYSLDLTGPEAHSLVAMGPSARHMSADALAAVAAAPSISVSIAFDLLLFERQDADASQQKRTWRRPGD